MEKELAAAFAANDDEIERALASVKERAAALNVDWRSLVSIMLPLLRPLVVDALKRLLERLGGENEGTVVPRT